jgi:hypothetical protein
MRMWLFTKISIYHTFITSSYWKNSFLEMKKFKLITWYPNMVQIMWNGMVQYIFIFHKKMKLFKLTLEYICVFEYIGTLHWFSQIYSNLHFIKWNEINFFLISCRNYILKHNMQKIVNFFQKFEMRYTQTSTPLENSIMWHPKGGRHSLLSPFTNLLNMKVTLAIHFENLCLQKPYWYAITCPL